MKHLRALNKYFWKYKGRLSVGIIFITLSNYFSVLQPQLTKYIIDFVQQKLPGYSPKADYSNYDFLVIRFIRFMNGIEATAMRTVIICSVVILMLALLRGFFMFLMRQTIIVMSRHIEYDQKKEVYKHYQILDASFYKSHSTGDLMSRMSEDVSRVRMFTGPAIMYLINLVTLIGMSVFFMYRREPQLTLYVLAPLPVLAITIYLVNTIIHRKSEAVQAALGAVTTNAQQSYSGIRVIKSFVQEASMVRHFENSGEAYRKGAVDLARTESLYFPSMTLLIGLSTLLTIMIGGMYAINGEKGVDISTIIEFVIYINMLTFPVSAIGWTASMIQRASASQKRLNEFLQVQPSVNQHTAGIRPDMNGGIRLDHVSFVYGQTGIEAVKNLSLTINQGEKVAVIGRTGSGKTTLAQLLMRMYNVNSGTISIGGTDIANVDAGYLRKGISYVPQDGFLFSDTVANNIAFGATGADMAKVKEAARLAVVDTDIEGFSQGYETEIGERGVTLSGGQKQRISIARALMKDAPVLILDDCLSAVDAKTEKAILTNLTQYLGNKTAIVITHRIFSLFDFDKIIILEEGKIAEQGRHAELLQARGAYYTMYHKQLQEEAQAG